MSCGWFHSPVDSSSGSWIRVAADSILRLTLVPTAGYELRLILSCDWLEFQWLNMTYSWFILQLTTSCGWFCPAADSSFGGWTRNAAELYFNISSKLKDLFCEIHHFSFAFYCLLSVTTYSGSACCFKNLEAAWRSLRKLEEASRL